MLVVSARLLPAAVGPRRAPVFAAAVVVAASAHGTAFDLDNDGRSDVLWRNAATGENYLYFMNGKDIAAEGYSRTVADPDWAVYSR